TKSIRLRARKKCLSPAATPRRSRGCNPRDAILIEPIRGDVCFAVISHPGQSCSPICHTGRQHAQGFQEKRPLSTMSWPPSEVTIQRGRLEHRRVWLWMAVSKPGHGVEDEF